MSEIDLIDELERLFLAASDDEYGYDNYAPIVRKSRLYKQLKHALKLQELVKEKIKQLIILLSAHQPECDCHACTLYKSKIKSFELLIEESEK